MITRGEITDSIVLALVPRIEWSDVRLLWHDDFWDGPISGMLTFHGHVYRYEMVAENGRDDTSWYRRFAVMRLSPDQLADESAWHELFRTHVGKHTTYDETGRRPIGESLPSEQWNAFYDAYRKRTPPDYSGNEVVGSFEL